MERDARSYHEEFVGRLSKLRGRSPNRQGAELYWFCKEIDGRPEGTGTFPLFAARLTKLSNLSNGRSTFYEPLGSYDDLLKLIRVNARLFEGGAPLWALNNLNVSVRLFESAYGVPLGKLPLPEPSDTEQGVHNVSVDGGWIQGGDALRFRNSWGKWGDEGNGLLSREYLERYMVEAWLSKTAAVGPSRFTRPLLRLNAADPKAYVGVWMLSSPLLRALNSSIESSILHHRAEHTIRIQETLSASEAVVEMVELHDPSGMPLGWAHLHHPVDVRSRVSVAKEFFVWPRVRDLGYGRLLEDFAAARAKKWGSEKLRILLHEADDYPGSVAMAKAFTNGAGYKWRWIFQQRPNVSAVADRSL